MSSHDISVCVYFAQGLLEFFDHVYSFFWWGVEYGALDVNIASECGEVGELGEQVFKFRVETVAPCYKLKTGSLLCLNEVNAIRFVKE